MIVSKIAIAITFIYHGLFAIGYYPQPGNFTDMLIIGFGIQEDMARSCIDRYRFDGFFVCRGCLIPFNFLYRKEVLSKVLKVIFITLLSYAVFWGFMTSIARFYIHFDSQFIWQSFEGFFHEFLVRLPHGSISNDYFNRISKKEKCLGLLFFLFCSGKKNVIQYQPITSRVWK